MGGHLWSQSSILQVLTSIKVLGKVEVNTANKELAQESLSPIERYKIVDASWPAIVEPDIFNQVQEKLAANKRFGKFHKHLYRLSGLLEGGICGKELSGQAANGRGGSYFYYAHSRKFSATGLTNHNDRCVLERIPAVRIEEAVINRLMEITKDRKLLSQLAQDSHISSADRTQELEQLIGTKEQARRNLERQIDNLLATIADLLAGVNPKTILAKVAELESHKEQLTDALGMLRHERNQAKGRVINMEQVFKLFRIFERGFGERPVHEQREIIKRVIVT